MRNTRNERGGAEPAPPLAPRVPPAIWSALIIGVLALLLASWFAGWRLKRVETGSMWPAVPKDSLAVIGPASPLRISEGDVIAFHDPLERSRIVLHRVLKVVNQEGSRRFFQTQGDANATPDALLVDAQAVEGSLRFHVPRLGAAVWGLRPPAGFIALAGVPLAALVVAELRARRRSGAPSEHVEAAGPPAPVRVASRSGAELTTLVACSWDRYFVPAPVSLRQRVADSWGDYYVLALPKVIELDAAERTIVLDELEPAER